MSEFNKRVESKKRIQDLGMAISETVSAFAKDNPDLRVSEIMAVAIGMVNAENDLVLKGQI
ncbi:MAG: hypothetical protein NZ735_01680 [Candidatus Marinimicrobia bacterium]|nr:hypothetical protein [Candidatus Neomarinimicrobiota bacterium]